jgi:hypothetical protein
MASGSCASKIAANPSTGISKLWSVFGFIAPSPLNSSESPDFSGYKTKIFFQLVIRRTPTGSFEQSVKYDVHLNPFFCANNNPVEYPLK